MAEGRERRWWRLDLAAWSAAVPDAPPGVRLAGPGAADAEVLAELMLDAYEGTIDSEGEDLDDARAEVAGWYELAGAWPPAMPSSVLAWRDERVVSAALVSPLEGQALMAYVVTAAASKGEGLGRLVVGQALARLRAGGATAVHAGITVGNEPSERLFAGLGFERGERVS